MIGKALKYMRKQKKLNQNDLIKLLNIGQSTLSDYENEKISIDFNTIEKIASICDYEIYFKNRVTNEKFQIKDLERKDI
mgnify:FL=1